MRISNEEKRIARRWVKDEITHVQACRELGVSLMGGYARLARILKEELYKVYQK